ncbi:hypothetical protein L3476_22665 [Paenibacillus thiaminolyticus]|uniref:hypothetical protein n=1 Tax=Paenibacillus thiaminolyticus TaxID=49283 RepID=UPI002350A742|nr:hypothetical protein [Paenibacillus thiaminolyticus]WCR26059.1 hypothetical protein L3476_22665 [Paenibacillus thiaminolyticus]
MDKTLFYTIARTVECQTNPGIKIEIRDYFKELDIITDFSINTFKNSYYITVRIRDCNIGEVKRIFHQFLEFIEYSAGTFYIRNSSIDLIEYNLLTFNPDKQGFHCQIKFICKT